MKRLIALLVAVGLGLGMTGCSRSPAEREARFLNRGKSYLEKNDPNRALLEFRNAAKAVPGDAEPYYQLALAYLALKDPAQAVAALRRAVGLNPKHSAAQLRLAELMAASATKSVVDEARKKLQGLLADSPSDPEVLNALALTEVRLGDAGDAEKHIEEALARAPAQLRSSILLAHLKLSQGDPAAAEDALKKAVRQAPQSVDAALALTAFLVKRRKLSEAEAECRRALQLSPGNPPALQALAAMQMSRGDTASAGKTYQQLASGPDKTYRTAHALFLLQTGQRPAAIAELERLYGEDPKDRGVRTRLVSAYLGAKRAPDAEKVLADALKKEKNDADALFQRSLLYLSAQRYVEAETDLMQVIHLRPDAATAHFALSRAKAGLGSSAGQKAELAEAVRLDPSLLAARAELSRIHIAEGHASAAVALLDEIPEPQKATLPARTARIRALLAAGDQVEARKAIDQAIAIGRAPELLHEDAVLKMLQKDFTGARASLQEVLEKEPEDLRAWHRLVQVYAAEKQLPVVVPKVRAAIVRHPQSAGLQYLLAEVLLAEGKQEEAVPVLAAIPPGDRLFDQAGLTLAALYLKSGAFDSARQRAAAVLAKNPKSVPAMLMLGEVENRAGRIPEAIARYREVAGMDGANRIALNNLAYLLAKEDPDAALSYAKKAAEIAPDDPAVLDTLGWVYYRKGFYRQALSNLQNAVVKGDTPLRRYHMAMAYFKLGNSAEGQKALDAALLADPNLPKKEGNW